MSWIYTPFLFLLHRCHLVRCSPFSDRGQHIIFQGGVGDLKNTLVDMSIPYLEVLQLHQISEIASLMVLIFSNMRNCVVPLSFLCFEKIKSVLSLDKMGGREI